MTQKARDFTIGGMNYYVPGMQAGADLGQMLTQRLSLGAPIVADADGILNDQSIAVAGSTSTFLATYSSANMSLYGRCVTVVASGAATSNVTVIGRDYLGQPMRESFTLNGTTPVVGVKAFKYVDTVTFGATAATTIDVGWNDKLGLPYKTVAVEREYSGDVTAAAGTLVAAVTTDPQTATTADPRGTYDPTTTLNGTAVISVDIQYSNTVNAAGNGGLHGIKHFNV